MYMYIIYIDGVNHILRVATKSPTIGLIFYVTSVAGSWKGWKNAFLQFMLPGAGVVALLGIIVIIDIYWHCWLSL